MSLVIDSAFRLFFGQLGVFANRDDFWSLFDVAFGKDYNRAAALRLRLQWQSGDFSNAPEIEVISRSILSSANGAYASSTNMIYLADAYVSDATTEALVGTLLEEYGHFVDAQVNLVDSGGDEGELFSALVRGVSLSAAELSRIKTEDDHAVVVIDGEDVVIEQALPTIPLIGSYTGLRDPRDVRVLGNYAYIADFLSSTDFRVIDISNPLSPILKSSFNNPGNISDLDVINNFAYGTDGSNGLRVINVSNPLSPGLTSTFNTSGDAQDVKISGQYAYVADGVSGLQIINIANPSSPIFVSNAGINIGIIGLVAAVDIVNNYAYTVSKSGSTGRLQIIDITNKSSPTKLGEYSFPGLDGTINHVSVVNNYAYIAAGDEGLKIIDVSNPSAPFLKGSYSYTSGGEAFDVQVIGKYAFVAMGVHGLDVIDISNPSSPVLAADYVPVIRYFGQSLTNFVTSVEIVNKYAFLTVQAPSSQGGLWIIDVDQFTPFRSNRTDFNGDGKNDIVLQNQAAGWAGIWTMDGSTVSGWAGLPSTSGGKIVGTGDFNGDGKNDVVLQGAGWAGVWTMNNNTVTGWAGLPSTSGGSIVGVGDFNGDGKNDIVLQNQAAGWAGIWTMNGSTVTGWAGLPSTSGGSIVGVGDFNGDGKNDIILQNQSAGWAGIWTMNGSSISGWAGLPSTSGARIVV